MRVVGICAILPTSARGPRSRVGEMPAGVRPLLVHHRVCPFIPLSPSWDEFVKRLSKNMRTNVGRRRRQVPKAVPRRVRPRRGGDPAGGDGGAVPPAQRALAAARRLGRLRRREHASVPPRGSAQVPRARLAPAASACVSTVRRGPPSIVSSSVGGSTTTSAASMWPSASSRSATCSWRRPSSAPSPTAPTEFDLLRGDETYKFAWKAEERETLRLILGRPALRSSFALGAHRLERYLEHKGLAIAAAAVGLARRGRREC